MNAIIAAATQTPWWVYLIFIVLIKRGITASKPQVVSMQKLIILPLVFIALSIHTVVTAFHVNSTIIGIWLVSILFGTLAGWLLVCKHQFKVDKKNYLIQLPGSWVTLILILLIFASKYYFGYEISADPALLKQTGFEFSLLGVTGICTGLFIGRVLFYFYQIKIGQSVDLSVEKKV